MTRAEVREIISGVLRLCFTDGVNARAFFCRFEPRFDPRGFQKTSNRGSPNLRSIVMPLQGSVEVTLPSTLTKYNFVPCLR